MSLGIRSRIAKVREALAEFQEQQMIDRVLDEPRYKPISNWIRTWQHHPFNRWSMATPALFRIYNLILEQQPFSCVEYGTGTGYSTIVMAAALAELGGNRKLVTLEQDPRILQFARTICPLRLEKWIDFTLAPIALKRYSGRPFLVYDYDAEQPFDFAVIDGPTAFVPETPTNGKLYVFYSKKREESWGRMEKREQEIRQASKDVFGTRHALKNFDIEELGRLGLLNQDGEVDSRTLREGALFQLAENVTRNPTIIVDGSVHPGWEPLLKAEGLVLEENWNAKSSIIYRSRA